MTYSIHVRNLKMDKIRKLSVVSPTDTEGNNMNII